MGVLYILLYLPLSPFYLQEIKMGVLYLLYIFSLKGQEIKMGVLYLF